MQKRKFSEMRQPIQNIHPDFYNSPCPEVSRYSISGEKINLRDLAGKVIIIRFSRFYRQDLPNLIYLQHLADKYRDQGVFLIFIDSIGKYDEDGVSKIVNLHFPIIEDDGYLRGLFNAYPEDTIIVDRDFTLKFKYQLASKPLIYNEVMKWAFSHQLPPLISEKELAQIIQNISFYDVLNEKRERVRQIRNKRILLTLFTSACTGCQETSRVLLLKEVARKLDSDKVKILLLFGKGNNAEAIRQYAILNEWDEFPFTVGVIEDSKDLSKREYYQLFQFDTDPRTFIIDSAGKLLFLETRKMSKMINLDYLKKLLG